MGLTAESALGEQPVLREHCSAKERVSHPPAQHNHAVGLGPARSRSTNGEVGCRFQGCLLGASPSRLLRSLARTPIFAPVWPVTSMASCSWLVTVVSVLTRALAMRRRADTNSLARPADVAEGPPRTWLGLVASERPPRRIGTAQRHHPLSDAAKEAVTMEYLVTMTTHVPERTSEGGVHDTRGHEAASSGELAAQGYFPRRWRSPHRPGEWRPLRLVATAGAAELETVLASTPLRVWRTDEVTPLSPQPVTRRGPAADGGGGHERAGPEGGDHHGWFSGHRRRRRRRVPATRLGGRHCLPHS